MIKFNDSAARPAAAAKAPSVLLSSIPIIFLLLAIVCVIVFFGADRVSEFGPWALLAAASVAVVSGVCSRTLRKSDFREGIRRSIRQTLPAVPLLIFIATVSATWMLSGVAPILIEYGLNILNPTMFLFIACTVCAFISILTGSSWTTIATIGVAFMGIGTVMGYNPGWVAGAIISGAYFGDKMSPLSDTTVIASASGGVDLFEHIRYMMLTSGPAMLLSLLVFASAGFLTDTHVGGDSTGSIIAGLKSTFNLTPWVLVIPAITGVMIAMRVSTLVTLAVSSFLGLTGIFVFQPEIVDFLCQGASGVVPLLNTIFRVLFTETLLSTGDEALDALVGTGGIEGMLPTIYLVLCAMTFGGVMMGTGMLKSISEAFTRIISRRGSLVATTAASGVMLNACTADQYLSIIISSNMYKPIYQKFNLESKLLSRTVEDSTSVTSVLIPWNSCGVTQSTVLGVATLTYLPFCVFNYLSPVMSIIMGVTGWRIRTVKPTLTALAKATN